MTTLTPNLWFDMNALEAAEFYASVFPDGRVDFVQRSPADNPSTRAGDVLLVGFSVLGQQFVAINGGPQFPFNESVSFQIGCESQGEADRYWDALIEGGGSHGRCGWLKDRFGVSWQVTPPGMVELLGGPDREGAARAMDAMLQMSRIDVELMRSAYEGRWME